MIESVEATTSTWQEMVEVLQQRLAKLLQVQTKTEQRICLHSMDLVFPLSNISQTTFKFT